jgi:hypothetical protein
MMREEDGRVRPILSAEALGAIRFGCCQQPTTATYPALRASRVPVLLVTPKEHLGREAVAREGIARLQAELPGLELRHLPGDVHDLVSHAADDVARIVGEWLRDVPRDP